VTRPGDRFARRPLLQALAVGGVAAAAVALSACTTPGAMVDGVVEVSETPSAAAALRLAPPESGTWVGRVMRIADGDTFTVEVVDAGIVGPPVGQSVRVRFLRIDTPELAHDGQPEQCWADEATALLTALTPVGSLVTLAYDVDHLDRYERELAHVWNEAGQWINGELLAAGAAEVATFRPNIAHDERVRSLESAAREQRRGRWGACPA